ncbi:uncharacterized protein LOC110882259 [Helianthus annuus]|uniref:uncharacterized protein LOC110882259 n=1 Tax=Helianthus annuus TaxID=4232 RepID=UPI00165317AE|nr:uncharacterized protein LOC110882259 [Helianthus annuus]
MVNADYNEASKIRKPQLSKIEEIRDEAYKCASTYKDKLKKVHDAKLKLFAGKLRSKWMGPNVITRVGRFGDIEIEDVHTQTKQVVNGHWIKPYLEGNDINNPELDKVGYILCPLDEVET